MTIVITGASSGIGAALTGSLSAASHRIFACARRAEALAQVTESGRLATPFVCDVSKEAEVAELGRFVAERADKVDALVNCAGAYGAIGPVEEVDSHEWLQTLLVNVYGAFVASKTFIPLMRRAGEGRIINFSGGGAFTPLPRYSAYAVSKAGIVRLTETLAAELAPARIWVNAVAPGFVATGIHQATLEAGPERSGAEFYRMTAEKMKQGAVPIEVPVRLVHFLLSPRADGLTGKTLSASFDPWDTPQFRDSIEALNRSPLYTMQRINLTHLAADDPVLRALRGRESGSGT